jgi:hypothetical protein
MLPEPPKKGVGFTISVKQNHLFYRKTIENPKTKPKTNKFIFKIMQSSRLLS